MTAKTIFNFKYDTNHIEVQEEKVETQLSDTLVEMFDDKIACFTNIVPKKVEEAFGEREAGMAMRNDDYEHPSEKRATTGAVKPSHAIKVGSAHFHPGIKGARMAAQRAKDLGVKAKIVPHPGGDLLGEDTDHFDNVEQIFEALPDWAKDVFDQETKTKKKSVGAAKASTDDEVASFNPKTDGKYKIQQFAKGRVVKGSYGSTNVADDDENESEAPKEKSAKPQFTVTNPWAPKPVAAAKGIAKAVKFPDKSKAELERTATAAHGPANNHEPMRVAMVPGGFAVVDNAGQIVMGKDGKQLTGYRKQGAAKIAMKRHLGEDMVYSISYSELAEEQKDNLGWVVEIIKEGSIHKYAVLDEADVIAEGVALTLDGALNGAYKKCVQMEDYVMSKVEQPKRVLDIVKSTVNK